VITSARHPLVRTLRRLGEHPHRDPQGRIVLDGPTLVSEALDAGVVIDAVLVARRDLGPRAAALVERLRGAAVAVHDATPRVVQAASGVVTSQGIVAIARAPAVAAMGLLDAPDLLLLVADGIQDPGNVGTLIRTAAAAGASAVALTEGTADPYHPKVVRAAMGAAFRVPLLPIERQVLGEELARRGVVVLVADAHRGTDYTEAPVSRPVAVVIGSEVAGPDPSWLEHGTVVRIPLYGAVESLNAAVAAGIVLYEIARRTRR
jgi:TrmH family RNA methyltransferase